MKTKNQTERKTCTSAVQQLEEPAKILLLQLYVTGCKSAKEEPPLFLWLPITTQGSWCDGLELNGAFGLAPGWSWSLKFRPEQQQTERTLQPEQQAA